MRRLVKLSDQVVVFTGTLVTMTRKEAPQLIVRLKGRIANHVSKEMTILVIGHYTKSLFDEEMLTKKEKLAQEYKSKGHLILLVNEKTFLELVLKELSLKYSSIIA